MLLQNEGVIIRVITDVDTHENIDMVVVRFSATSFGVKSYDGTQVTNWDETNQCWVIDTEALT